jgi:hypothetical protein
MLLCLGLVIENRNERAKGNDVCRLPMEATIQLATLPVRLARVPQVTRLGACEGLCGGLCHH